jgi:hypothetical protein
MTGYESKKAMALHKLDDDDIQVYQRPWVGLTTDEVSALSKSMPYANRLEFASALISLLKDKNT